MDPNENEKDETKEAVEKKRWIQPVIEEHDLVENTQSSLFSSGQFDGMIDYS